MATAASVAAVRGLSGALVKSSGAEGHAKATGKQPGAVTVCAAVCPRAGQRGGVRADFLGRRLEAATAVSATSGNGAHSSTAEVAPEVTNAKPVDIPSGNNSASKVEDPLEETSSFIAEVASLIKLVDSRDIVELELKHKGVEISIRKKEALAPPPAPVQQPMQMAPQYFSQAPAPAPAPAPAAPAPAPAAAAPPPPAPAASSGPPPMMSPMAGTFYRCPAPGEPPFVKQGDRVVKGQVICIIEAMKLMNEVEADQSGTITEIIAEDTKAVAAGAPLFKIVP